VQRAGCSTYVSCEGHPRGAYVGFTGDQVDRARLESEFDRLGWHVEPNPERTIVRMPEVSTVEERDAEWRRLSLEFDYGIIVEAQQPSPR